MFTGMSQQPAPHGGKGRTGSMGIFSNGLSAGTTGLAPAESRNGVAREAPVRHLAINNAMRARSTKEASHPARRHVDPVHVDFSDAQKRQEGRLGKAHVEVNAQQQQARLFYAGGQRPLVQPVPGQENNLALKSYQYTPLSKQERSPPPRGQRPQTADASASLDELTSSRNPQLTSIQLAEARLRQIAHEAPRFREEANTTLHTYHGYPEVVSEEQKLSRLVAVERYYDGSVDRLARMESTTKYHGTPNLGQPSERLEDSTPFALQTSAPRADNVEVGHASGLRITHNHNRTTQQALPRERKMDRHLYDGPTPYDTAALSRSAYPSPPKPGVSQGLYSKPYLVQHDARRDATCHQDRDTLALKRAREARGVTHPQSDQSADFIFGSGSPVGTPNKAPTLQARMESKCERENDRQQQRHTGVAMVGPRYKKTALW